MTAHSLLHMFTGGPDALGFLEVLPALRVEPLRQPVRAGHAGGTAGGGSHVELGELDVALFDALGMDGRASYAELAAATGWSESTVRRRMDQLRAAGMLYFDVELDMPAFGFRSATWLWLSVPPAELAAAGTALAKFPEVAYAAATTGAANLAACVICRDEAEFYEFLTAKAATLPGVQRVETAPIIRTMKQASPARSPSPPEPGEPWQSQPGTSDKSLTTLMRCLSRTPVEQKTAARAGAQGQAAAQAADPVAAIGGGAVIVAAAIAVGVTLAVSGGSSATPAGYAPLSTLGALQPAPAGGPLGPEAVPVPSAPAWPAPRPPQRVARRRHQLQHGRADDLPHPRAPDDLRERRGPPGPGVDRNPWRGRAADPSRAVHRLGNMLFLAARARRRTGSCPSSRRCSGPSRSASSSTMGPAARQDVVRPAHGHVTVLVNGKVFTGNQRDVPLTKRAEIRLEVGTPLVAPESMSWGNTGL